MSDKHEFNDAYNDGYCAVCGMEWLFGNHLRQSQREKLKGLLK